MKWRWVFVGAFLVLGLLVACVEGEEVVMRTAVPSPPPTIEPTVTETAVPVTEVEETTTLTIPAETPIPPSPLHESVFDEARGGLYLDERLTWPFLQTAVVSYLNQNQLVLEDGNIVSLLNLKRLYLGWLDIILDGEN